MKKFIALVLASACVLNLAGCGNQTKTEVGEAIKQEDVNVCEYSFNGENEILSISNGHIYIDKISRFVGGELQIVDQEAWEEVASYSEKYYVIADDEIHTILSNTVKDETGTPINVGGIGEISGEELLDAFKSGDFVNNLWYEIKTVNIDGEEQVYKVQLNVDVVE